MMYQDKLAVALKHNGKFLRENKDIVQIPFGSEFSVLVKNLNSRRVKFTLHIDGADVLDGTEIIVRANSEVELKRFIRNGNMDEGNAFKFIERTQSIEDGPRGIKVDDGIVRIEFWFEQEQPEIKIKDIYWEKYHYRDYYPHSSPWYGPRFGSDPIYCVGSGSASGISGSLATDRQVLNSVSAQTATFGDVKGTFADKEGTFAATSATRSVPEVPKNDAGITVPGSKVEQKFNTVYGFNAEVNSHTIILRLVGMVGTSEVKEAITVKTKNVCSTCSHTNKHNAKYCGQCGTALELF